MDCDTAMSIFKRFVQDMPRQLEIAAQLLQRKSAAHMGGASRMPEE
ncbi:MAG: hypothetical protein K5663_04935 [Clostridiales bacterium]|nr:hypothetical protein [Clostridiales bacterium]